MKPGVTGFSEEELSQQKIKTFEAYLFHAIRNENAKIVYKEHPLNYKTFCTYQISTREMDFYILLHTIYPFVTFASEVDFSGIKFIDGPEPVKSIIAENYTVIDKELLNQTLTQEATITLRTAEQKMIKYWNPKTIGEVIFNYWD